MAKYVRRYWLHIGGYTLLNMTGSLLGLGTSMVSRTLVDSVTGHNSGLLGIAAAAYVGVGVGQIFISAIRSRLSLKINLHISNGVRLDIFHQIIETDWESLSEFSPGDLQYRLNGDVMAVINNVLTFIPSLCSMLVSFGGALIVMLQNDPTMAAIALCGAPISLIVSRYNIRKMREYEKKNQEFASKNVSFNQEIFQHMQTIKAFGLVDTFTRRYEDRQKESVRIQLDRNKFQQRGSIATSLVGQAIGYACYGFAIYRLWKGDITYGSMTMLVGMAGSLRGSFSSVVNLVPQRHPRLHQCRADYGSHRPAPGGVGGIPKPPQNFFQSQGNRRFRKNGKRHRRVIPGTRQFTPAPTFWQARGRSSAWWAPLDWVKPPR